MSRMFKFATFLAQGAGHARIAPLGPCVMAFAWATTAAAQSRVKDIVDVEGVRENLLVGYGLVVVLNGTGDSLNSAVFTRESLIGMLERRAVNAFVGQTVAQVSDPGTTVLRVRRTYKDRVIDFLTDVEPDQVANVVIDEPAGVIVMGANVRISTVAIAQGILTIRITE